MAQSSISKIFSTTFLLVLMFMMSHTAESRLLTVDITKADVSVAKKGEGLARVDTQGVNVGKHGNIAKVGEANVFVAQKGHGIADVHHDDIDVGKGGSIAHVEKNEISVGKQGHPAVDLGKVQAHALRGPRQ